MSRINDIRIKKENILFFVAILPVIVDQLNGFMQFEMGISFSISQVVKTAYLMISFVFLAKFNRKYLIFILIFILILSVPIIMNLFSDRIIFLSAFGDLAFVFKVASFPVFLLTFISLTTKSDDIITIKLCHRIVSWIFYIILFALLASVAGFGRGMYGDIENTKVGFKGYFIAGNELSSLFLVIYTFFLYFSILSDSSKKIFFKIFQGMLCAVLMSTKTTLLSFVLITTLVPVLNYFFSGGSFFKLVCDNKKKIVVGTGFLLAALAGLYYTFKENIDLYIDKMSHALKVADSFFTFMLSARNLRYADSFNVFHKYSFWEKTFGTGWTYPQHFIESRLYGWGSAETDWLDLLITHGFVGVIMVYLFWLLVLLTTAKFYFLKKQRIAVPSLVALSLLMVNTTFSGHILYSAMTGIYLALFLAFQFKNENEE